MSELFKVVAATMLFHVEVAKSPLETLERIRHSVTDDFWDFMKLGWLSLAGHVCLTLGRCAGRAVYCADEPFVARTHTHRCRHVSGWKMN